MPDLPTSPERSPPPAAGGEGGVRRALRRAFGSILDLREGEVHVALRAFALLALLICGHTLLETARDALFLGKLPASRLAFVYALISGLALAVSAANARFIRKVGESRALVVTLVGAAAGTSALYLQRPTPTLVFVLYVWSALASTVMVVQLWMFLAQVFTPSQGKRLFGPIAAGGVIGAIVGASGAAVVLPLVPVRSLLLAAAGAFLLAALLSRTIGAPPAPSGELSESGAALADEPSARDGPPSGPGEPGSGTSPLFRRRAYVGWLVVVTALSTAAVLGTDYLFKADAASRVPPDRLGDYFARSYAVFNGVALGVQVLVAGPLLRRLGVARTMLVTPLLLLGGAGAVLLTGAHAAVLLTKGVDGSLRHSLQQVTGELLGLPISAGDRTRVKPLIEGVLKRSVQAAMAGVLLLLATTGHGSPREISALVLVLTAGWLVAAIAIRGPYLDMFRHEVLKTSAGERRAGLDPKLTSALLEALWSREPASAIAALHLLAEGGRARFIPARVLFHESEEVQVHALDLMRTTTRREWVRRAERLLATSLSEPVRVAATRALAACDALDAVRIAVHDPSPAVRAHAALTLACVRPSDDPLAAPLLAEILTMTGPAGHKGRLALLDALRDRADPRFSEVILAMVRHPDPEIVERAVLAMASVRDPRFIPALVEHLYIRVTRPAAREALVHLGERAQEALERALRSEATRRAVRLHIPRTLSRFENQRAADFLTEQLAIETSRLVRYKVLRGLGRLVASADVRLDEAAVLTELRRNLIEHLTLLAKWLPLDENPESRRAPGGQLLLGLLADKLRQSLERAFRSLHIAHPREHIRRVYVALSSSDERGRSMAMEFVDALTSEMAGDLAQETRELLKLVIDDLPPDLKVERAVEHVPEPPRSVEATLLLLVRDRDASLAALATFHAVELGLSRVRDEAQRIARDRPSLRELIASVLERPAVDREVQSALQHP